MHNKPSYKYFYTSEGQMIATLAYMVSDGVLQYGIAVASPKDVAGKSINKEMGRKVAVGRLTTGRKELRFRSNPTVCLQSGFLGTSAGLDSAVLGFLHAVATRHNVGASFPIQTRSKVAGKKRDIFGRARVGVFTDDDGAENASFVFDKFDKIAPSETPLTVMSLTL